MHAVRKYLSWIFALAFFIGVPITFRTTLTIFGAFRQYDPDIHLSPSRWLLLVVIPWVMPIQTAVFGMAWWTGFREKRSARAWGIAASFVFIAWVLLPLALPPRFFWSGDLILLGIGLVGAVAFSWRVQPSETADEAPKKTKRPGDWTNTVFNRAVEVAMVLVAWRAYHWWINWLSDNDLTPPGFITGTVILLLIGLVLVALHELGHAAVGLLLGMKLCAFLVGPFQWRIRDGKWGFHFEPRQILATAGATGIVPAKPDFSRWRHLCMLSAGVFSNIVTGATALGFALAGAGSGSRGLLALFGAFSLALAPMNLIPFRWRDTYSDGAQILQMLSEGAWGDFHRVMATMGASLVSPVRPRDYDIEAIHRASAVITEGAQGLLLRLLAYCYFLDVGNPTAAGEELVQAASIYNTSASGCPTALVTPFVFASAYIWRSADSARQWWSHVEAKKTTRLNADYWLAHAALHWVEGDGNTARNSLEKAQALAQQLPAAGAYEFERYQCSLLRNALSEVAAAHT